MPPWPQRAGRGAALLEVADWLPVEMINIIYDQIKCPDNPDKERRLAQD
jgi:hypothetical protein